MIRDPAQPIDVIFNSIDDLVEYARAAEAELTQSQTINLALVILNRQRIFKDDIQEWKRTNHSYKTWYNFKHDFRKAALNSEKQEVLLINSASTTLTPLSTR